MVSGLMLVLVVLAALLACSAKAKLLHNSLSRLHGGNDDNGAVPPTDNVEIRDVVIIGSGPAGCTAAIYTGRALLRPLVIAGYMAGGQLMLTSDVENFPGYRDPISGPMMMDDLKHQAIRFGAEFWQTNVQSVDLSKEPFEIILNNCTIKARTVIISTGAEALWLNSQNEEEFKGKGISTCATCDGYMFRNKPVIVIGGGDSAMEEANFLTRFASEVTLIHRKDSFRASKVMIQRAYNNNKIKVKTNQKVVQWLGNNGILSGAVIENIVDGSRETITADGAFIAIGHKPNTEFLRNQLKLADNGYIELSEYTMTSIPGVFACGDVVDSRYRQAITAAGSGCQAAIDAERYLETKH